MADGMIAGNLSAGQFYGNVPQKRVLASSILSEVVHRNAVEVPAHSHELAYFTLVLGGAYSEKFAGATSEHRPMSILWHRDGISHKDKIGRAGARFFTIEVKNDRLESLRQYSEVPQDFCEHSSPLVWLTTRLFYEFKNWQDCSPLVAEGLTLEMLGHSARSVQGAEKHAPKWLGRVVDRLNHEFTGTISNDDLAFAVDVHPIHLAAVFRKFKRQTIGEYVQQLRISHASELLIKGELPLADVACESGFSDQSHMNRIFKRYTNITPGAFRALLN
jgi:AraC family transcriptional regulator